MHLIRILITLLLVLKCVVEVNSFVDPLSFAFYSAVAAGLTFLYNNKETRDKSIEYAKKASEKVCQLAGFCEGCEDAWIHPNLEGLEYELKSGVFGQPLALEIILSSLKSHLSNRKPTRPLVLSFQGSPGTGKNFVSQKILENLFKKGGGSKYIKFYRSTIDFSSKSEVHQYRESIARTIKNLVQECYRSVFIFDEVEKMPDGVLDVISGFVSAPRDRENDYRRVIFILLSNVGSEALMREVLAAWKQGLRREDISSSKLSRILATEAYNNEGGLKKTRLVKNHDVSHYVPFLPLEQQHVIQCLAREVANRNQIMSRELTELVLDELTFYPEDVPVFASGGCKGVAEKADYLIERASRKKRMKN